MLLCCGLPIHSQINYGRPQWINNVPEANSKNHFYYRVTLGEGQSLDRAYANAFAKAIIEAKWRLGVRVKVSDDVNALEQEITKSINVDEQTMLIPINKVCEYWEEYYSPKKIYRMYVLWQIADDGRFDPIFEEFTKCQ